MAKVVSFVQEKENRLRTKIKREKERRKWALRLLCPGEVRVASRHYSCDYCIESIVSGDQYTREVWVNYKYLQVTRRHYPNCNAPTEDEVQEELDRIEQEGHAERATSFRKSA